MKGSAALGMAPLEPGRQQAIDDAWSALRRVVDDVRKEVWTQYEIREQIIADLEEIRMGLPDPSGVGGDSHSDELVEEWHESLSALHEVMAKQEQNVTIELDAGLELLTLAKAERRDSSIGQSRSFGRIHQSLYPNSYGTGSFRFSWKVIGAH